MFETAFRLHIEEVEPGVFVATSLDVPSLVAQGRSVHEATRMAQDLARKIAESCIEHGDPLPPALARKTDSTQHRNLVVPVGVA